MTERGTFTAWSFSCGTKLFTVTTELSGRVVDMFGIFCLKEWGSMLEKQSLKCKLWHIDRDYIHSYLGTDMWNILFLDNI